MSESLAHVLVASSREIGCGLEVLERYRQPPRDYGRPRQRFAGVTVAHLAPPEIANAIATAASSA